MGFERKLNLKEGERVRKVLTRYWITYFPTWLGITILVGVPFFFMFWLFNHGRWGQALFFIPVTLGLLWLVRTLVVWKKNVLVVTTDRLIDIDQRGILKVLYLT